MIKHKALTDELLRIAYLPKEDRNIELETLKRLLNSYNEDEMPKIQKDLVQEIIQDLINENTVYENGVKKVSSKPKVVTKPTQEIEVIEPEIVVEEPKIKTEPITEKLSIEDIDDAF